MSLLVLSATDVDRVVAKFTPTELVDLMAKVFIDLSLSSRDGAASGKSVSIPHRSTVSSPNHNTLFMPSRLAPLAGTAIKVVSVPTAKAPSEIKARGLPASTLVLDEQTGEIAAVVNARKLTALRNAASSLLASTLIVSSPPQSIVAIGAGAQIAAHLSLFLAHYPTITSCIVINRTFNPRLTSLVADLHSKHPTVHISAQTLVDGHAQESPDLRTAISQANIIITATSATEPLFPSGYVAGGTFLALIGSYTPAMHEVDTPLVARASRVVVDYRAGAAAEAGELISAGIQPADLVELGELLAPSVSDGKWAANKDAVAEVRKGEVLLFKSVGVGVQDVAIAQAVVKRAREAGVGTVVEGYQ